MRHVPFVDATGVYRLKQVIKEFQGRKVSVILSGVNSEVREELEQAGIYDIVERANLSDNINSSVKRAREILDNNKV